MSDVLAVIVSGGPSLSRSDEAAIGFACQVAEGLSSACDVLILGGDVSAAAEKAATIAVRKVLVAEHPQLAEATGESRTSAICTAAEAGNYRLISAASTTFSRDCLPRVAARLGGAMASDVLSIVNVTPEVLGFTKPCFSGNLIQHIELTGNVGVATARASSFEAPTEGDAPAPIERVELPEQLGHARKRFVKLDKTELDRPELTEADIVVSGGRGTRGAEGFVLLEELADLLGAAVGASRAVVDAGWMPNDFQVGQTGKVIAPKLYLCAGLSGAIQHLAGMRNSKTIVAINKDANAPIFEIADIGLVADLFDAVPKLTAAIRAARQEA